MQTIIKKRALITGAGRGIGKAIALKLAQDNFDVILLARNSSELTQVKNEIKTSGGNADIMMGDVTDQQLVYQLIDSLDPIDVLVNNAGRGGGGRTAEMDDDLWHSIITTNLHSVYYVTKAVLSKNKMKKPGAIINIASTGGKQGVVFAAAYSASKHGIVGFSKALGLELARQDITVNAVCPGFVETSMATRVREGYSKLWNVTPEEAKKRIEERVPIGRYIHPEEVADMVSFLVSPLARGMTAQAINVCGGLGNY